jgi:lysophospholipase L1-like esterase
MKRELLKVVTVTLAILSLNSTVFSQDPLFLKWYNPAESSFPVIEGRGWQTGMANTYDRLPSKAEKEVRPSVWSLSGNSAGEYINFTTSAKNFVVRFVVTGNLSMSHMPSTGVSGVDLYARDVNGEWRWAGGKFSFGDTIVYRFSSLSLSAPEEEFRLYLPLYNTVKWLNIGVDGKESFKFQRISRERPIVVYGTSIAQGGCASRPGLAWTNILGRKIDRTIINLGFSGNGQLEKPLIELMKETDACLYVLDCMPNLISEVSFPKQEIMDRILSSVKELQSENSAIPILLVEHSGGLSSANMNAKMVNDYKATSNILDEAFGQMKKDGFRNIYLLTDSAIGLDNESTVDGTHPNDIGMMKHAEAYEKIIREILGEEKGIISTTIPIRQRRDHATYDFIERHEAVLETVKSRLPAVVLIGNSITHFWGGFPEGAHKTGSESWDKYFAPVNTVNLGFGWDRIENVLWRVHHGELDGYLAEKIVINIGTNNLSIGDADEKILEGLKFMTAAIRQHQGYAKIFLSGIYPRRDFEQRIESLNNKIESMAKEINVIYINPGVVLLGKDKKIDETLFSDGLHPKKEGYEKLGAKIAGSLR